MCRSRSQHPAGSMPTTATRSACFPREQPSHPNDIYEFSYTAKDPTVNGIGFAAVRDFNSFLRYAAADSGGTSNPLAGDVTRIYTFAVSQPARMLNDFRNLGFNEDENGKIVFDGMLQWIAAGDGINLNYRFSQPGRTERNRQDQLYAEGVFPFANQRIDRSDHREDRRPLRHVRHDAKRVRWAWKFTRRTNTG